MSCNGCRVLRKGCSDSCFLRQCLKWIESPDAQGHATVFVAKFFGRAGMMALISSVPEAQRPALFQSLLYEACGRTVNPVYGAVGLLCSGNWNLCQSAVETVMNGGLLCPAAASLSSTGKPVAAMMMHSFNNNNNNNNNDNSSNNNNNKATSTKLPRVRLGRGFIQTPPEYYTDNNNSNKQEGCVEDNNNMYTVIDNNNNNSNKRRRSLEEVVECNNRTTSSPLVRRTNRPRRQQQQQQQQQEDVAAVKEEEEVEEEEEELGLDLTLGTSTSCRKKRNLQENISDEDYTTPLPPKRTASPCPSEADSDTTELSISPWSSIQSRPLLRRDVAKTAAF